MYYAVVNWYNDFKEEDEVNRVLVLAKDWNEAMQKITSEFQWINSLEMKEIECGGPANLVYLPEDCIEAIIKENDY